MHSRIALITPVITPGIRMLDDVKSLERPDLSVTHMLIDKGPASIESEFDEALSVPDTIRKAIDAEKNGANAIIIDCMGDPGMSACREAVAIPVLGPCQTSLHMASLLGHRIGFITVLDRIRPLIDRLVAIYGLQQHYASFRAVDIPVLDIGHDAARLQQALAREAVAAVKEDGADVLVLGCTGFFGCAGSMTAALRGAGCEVPVIDPIPLTVHAADALLKCGLTHSKRTYPYPGAKQVSGFSFPEFAPRHAT